MVNFNRKLLKLTVSMIPSCLAIGQVVVTLSVSWLVSWLVGWLVGWLVCWSVCRSRSNKNKLKQYNKAFSALEAISNDTASAH